MIRVFFSLFTFQILCNTYYSTYLSYINSATYIPTNFSSVQLYYGTCSECICRAFFSNSSPNYEAVACYATNQTCLLFPQFLSRSNIRIDINAKFIYKQITATTIGCNNINTQCGGTGWGGTTSCCTGLSCVYQNTSYSQCLSTTTSTTTTTTSTMNDSRQDASTGVYWDCCKLSCGWPNKANVTNPARTCTLDGMTTINSNTQSFCSNGSAYMCTDQQPWNVSDTLSYGFAGGYISGQGEANWCCACYSILFSSGPVYGKELIVQVTNTAYTSGNMFVLQIPGGGWSSSTNGCPSQFGSNYTWGNQFGGITDRTNCSRLPSVLRAGCYWRFDWFMNAYNPIGRFKQVTCPTALTSKSGCVRT